MYSMLLISKGRIQLDAPGVYHDYYSDPCRHDDITYMYIGCTPTMRISVQITVSDE